MLAETPPRRLPDVTTAIELRVLAARRRADGRARRRAPLLDGRRSAGSSGRARAACGVRDLGEAGSSSQRLVLRNGRRRSVHTLSADPPASRPQAARSRLSRLALLNLNEFVYVD